MIRWSPTATSAYGPAANTKIRVFGVDTEIFGTDSDKWIEAIAWRGYAIDPTGFIHMGDRYYDYQAGRFISTDPLGHAASADLYSFAGADPINHLDPWGRGFVGLDGTHFQETGKNGEHAGPGVIYKLFENYQGSGARVYVAGPGNESQNNKAMQAIRGLTGFGARQNVNDAYSTIVEQYNNGDTYTVVAGWSRGAAEAVELSHTLQNRGVPDLSSPTKTVISNSGSRFGANVQTTHTNYLVPPHSGATVIAQLILLDTVPSMGIPDPWINLFYTTNSIANNIDNSVHFIASQHEGFGFNRTRPSNIQEFTIFGGHNTLGTSNYVYNRATQFANKNAGTEIFGPLNNAANSVKPTWSILDKSK